MGKVHEIDGDQEQFWRMAIEPALMLSWEMGHMLPQPHHLLLIVEFDILANQLLKHNKLQWRNIFVIPDILCNAGGVFVSYLEYTQETQREQMTLDQKSNTCLDIAQVL